MTMPLYVPPEQIIKDRADFAKRGVARGRPAVVISTAEGVLLAASNPSRALNKLSEIYDRLAFAGVGKWSEFEALRVAGIRYADLRGYSYDRTDVSARGLAGAYAQSIAAAFTGDPKPLEVELAVAEVGKDQLSDAVFHVRFDGSVSDELPWAVLGGATVAGRQAVAEGWRPGLSLAEASRLARAALAVDQAVQNCQTSQAAGSARSAVAAEQAAQSARGTVAVEQPAGSARGGLSVDQPAQNGQLGQTARKRRPSAGSANNVPGGASVASGTSAATGITEDGFEVGLLRRGVSGRAFVRLETLA